MNNPPINDLDLIFEKLKSLEKLLEEIVSLLIADTPPEEPQSKRW